ncbi:uncharacterized protein LOC124151187 isoform X2 [Haliotis rufescens]|uniref:uncharacterized protein LOC124151187 isoform X2 n=1 Tax=Haliotis rufescens TaxID=6454 RepID=UPI00201EFE64|nr:uncharacterized protein LOC124151187 isoform X2 [Haliotis rufescens]
MAGAEGDRGESSMARVIYTKDACSSEVVVSWPSNSPLLPRIRLQDGQFEAIQSHVLTPGKLAVYPPMIANKMHNIIRKRIKSHGKHFQGGLSFVTSSLAVMLNLPKMDTPNGVTSEVFYVFPDRPSMILCFVCEKREDLGKYVLRLARRVINQIRRYTDEHFSAVYGLLDASDLVSDDLFTNALRLIEDKTSTLCSLHALNMNSGKCINIIRAFLAAVAVTDHTEGHDMKQELRLLSKQQFCILVENIDEDIVMIDTAKCTGAQECSEMYELMIEVARWLEKRGQTILVIDEDLQKTLQEQPKGLPSHIVASDKLKDVSGDDFPEIQHIVAANIHIDDIKKFHTKGERSGKSVIWLFSNSEEEVIHAEAPDHEIEVEFRDENSELLFSGDTSSNGSADEMSRSRKEEGYWSEGNDSDGDEKDAVQSSDDGREADEIQLQDETTTGRLLACTSHTINDWISGTAPSPLLPHVTKCLKDHSCTTIIGQPGDGKTTLAHQVLSQMHRKKWKVYVVETPQEYIQIQKSEKYIILFNNIFGIPNFKIEEYQKWIPVLEDITQELEASDSTYQVLYSIFLFRTNVFQTAIKHITPFKNIIFSERQRIDFETVYDAEREKTQATDRRNDILNDSVTDCSTTSSPLLRKLCMMKERKDETFNTMTTDRESICREMIQELILNERILSTLQICIHQDYIPNPSELSNVELATLCTSAGASAIRSKQLSEALAQMEAYILKTTVNGFIFSHSWTSEIVAKVLAEHDETIFIVRCSLKYLEHVRLEPSELAEFDYAIIVNHKSAKVLAERLSNEMRKGHLHFVLSHVSLKHPVVFRAVQQLLQYRETFKIRDAQSGEQIQSLIPICHIPTLEQKLLEIPLDGVCTMRCLRMCSRYGNVRLMRLLLEKKARILQEQQNKVGDLLITCAKWNHTEGCKAMLEYADVNSVSRSGNTCLHYAASSDNLELLSLLLDEDGINVDLLNNKKESALSKALYCKHEQVAEALIEAGANTQLKDRYCRTSFLIAALVGSVPILKRLLKSDHRYIDHRDNMENTALHLAAMKGQTDAIELLLKEDFDIQKVNVDKMTPLHMAARSGKYLVVAPLLSIERKSASSGKHGKPIIRSMSVDLKDIHGMAPLHYAAMWGYEYVLGRLLQNMCEINLRTEKSETALHLATQGDHIETVQSLLKNKADPSLSDRKGRTPLHIAAQEGHLKIVKLFLRENVPTQKVDEDNKTACDLAHANRHRSIVKEIKVQQKKTKRAEKFDEKLESSLHQQCGMINANISRFVVPCVTAIVLCDAFGILYYNLS